MILVVVWNANVVNRDVSQNGRLRVVMSLIHLYPKKLLFLLLLLHITSSS